MKFEEDFYAGYPALTRHAFGAGNAFYVCTDAEQTFLDKLFGKIAEELKLEPILPALPDGTCVSSRCDEQYEYVFIQHFGSDAVRIQLPLDADILLGDRDGYMNGYSTAIFRRTKPDLSVDRTCSR